MPAEGGDIVMTQNIKVVIDERFGVDKSLRRFKRLCDSFGIVKEYRKRQEYKKPSVRLKEKQEAAEKRRRKAIVKGRRSYKKI
jgi:small subunit ribosomal protein S21